MSLLSARKYCLLFIAILLHAASYAGSALALMELGWKALVIDNDTAALRYFGQAYLVAEKDNNTGDKAQALLYMGICSYGVSYTRGLDYCFKAMDEYKKLGKTAPAKALEGRSKCLQLVSTIKGRQGKYRESILLSTEAMNGFAAGDTTGYLGLIYNSIGSAYGRLKMRDSSAYFHRKALAEHLRAGNFTYLPTACIQVAGLEREKGNRQSSYDLYARAGKIADSTGNRQAQVSALLGMGEWEWTFNKNAPAVSNYYTKADSIAALLTDRTFSLKCAEHWLDLYKASGDYKQAMVYQVRTGEIKDSIYSWDRQKEVKNIEIQFDVAEKDRQLQIARKENEVATLTNLLLWGGIGMIAVAATGCILFLRRINKRDKLLLQTKEELVTLIAEQKRLREQQMQQELEYKESQLSAMTLQMLQKNELMQELKERLEQDKGYAGDNAINKIISKGLTQDKEWSDFNAHFESINKHFYTRLKQAYPDISQNDLKICALIKLNLSIKEMAAILNISPDSVKTARYRLRKKLQLNTEDNLGEFIMGL